MAIIISTIDMLMYTIICRIYLSIRLKTDENLNKAFYEDHKKPFCYYVYKFLLGCTLIFMVLSIIYLIIMY